MSASSVSIDVGALGGILLITLVRFFVAVLAGALKHKKFYEFACVYVPIVFQANCFAPLGTTYATLGFMSFSDVCQTFI